MSNAIVNPTPTPAAVAGWILKTGKAKQAFTETAALSSPAYVRKARAAASDLDKLNNGQFRPFILQVSELCSVKEKATITQGVSLSAKSQARMLAGANPLTLIQDSLDAPDKGVAVSFARVVSGMWSAAKGQKLAHATIARQWLAALEAPAPIEALTLQDDSTALEGAYLAAGFSDDSVESLDNIAATA